jgi:hypothetical protein
MNEDQKVIGIDMFHDFQIHRVTGPVDGPDEWNQVELSRVFLEAGIAGLRMAYLNTD